MNSVNNLIMVLQEQQFIIFEAILEIQVVYVQEQIVKGSTFYDY